MKNLFIGFVFVSIMILGGAIYAEAVPLFGIDDKLIGATNINVGGEFFDVSFTDGSASTTFSIFPDFIFSSDDEAMEASQALRDQVLSEHYHLSAINGLDYWDDPRRFLPNFNLDTLDCESHDFG